MKLKVTTSLFFFIFCGIILLLCTIGKSSNDDTYSHKTSLNKIPLRETFLTEDNKTNCEEIAKEINSQLVSPSYLVFCKPILQSGVSEQIIKKKAFITSYNKDTRTPNWVAWHLTSNHTDGTYGRLSNFHEEEDVPTPRATLEDYRKSGWSRGHMCPAGDNKWDEEAMFESFSLVNVCPQNGSLNSGLWNRIEMDCRKWAKKYGSVYIVCGPIFNEKNHKTIGVNKIVVPEAFFKVVLCLQGTPKAIGFIVKNNTGTKKKDQYVNTIDEVERITGYDFFPSLPDSIEKKVEAYSNLENWKR